MKVLHTTDLHFNQDWFKWIKEEQDNYDIFCITGDFLEQSKIETLSEQIDWITKWMEEFKKPLFICSGNHDIEEPSNEHWFNHIPNIYSDNSIETINGVTIGCIPYTSPVLCEFEACDILLHHVPPSDTNVATHNKTNVDWGDKELSIALKNSTIKPKFLLCGHMHYPIATMDKIKDTVVYNTGVNKHSTIPNNQIIEI